MKTVVPVSSIYHNQSCIINENNFMNKYQIQITNLIENSSNIVGQNKNVNI